MGEINAYNILVRKREGKRDHLEDPDLDGRTLIWILCKYSERVWTYILTLFETQ
jgi:hypothetical protein